jgi:hypothetical protein
MTKITGSIKFLGIIILAFFVKSSMLFALATAFDAATLQNANDVAEKVVTTKALEEATLATIAYPVPSHYFTEAAGSYRPLQSESPEDVGNYYKRLKLYGDSRRDSVEKDQPYIELRDPFIPFIAGDKRIKIMPTIFFGDDFDKKDDLGEDIVSSHDSSWTNDRQTLEITPKLNVRTPKELVVTGYRKIYPSEFLKEFEITGYRKIYPSEFLKEFEIREAAIDRFVMGDVKEEEKDSTHWANVQILTMASMARTNPNDFDDFVAYINAPESQVYDTKNTIPAQKYRDAVNWFDQNKGIFQAPEFAFFPGNEKTVDGFLKSLAKIENFDKKAFTQHSEALKLAHSA